MNGSVTFYLPFGLVLDGNLYRKGTMHLATTGDELDIQSTDEAGMNTRYRDILLLAKVIDELDGLKPVTREMIENLFEADFLYLQLLYREMNSELPTQITAVCPQCHREHPVMLPELYRDMSIYQKA
jgi:hypothetical protein